MRSLSDEVDALFVPWDREDSPGCALAIVQDGRITYSRGYGMADLEHEVPMTTNAVFDIASTSKQFVALCAVLLAREKALDLDDEIQIYLPEIRRYEHPITIRQLIHHTSGLRDYCVLMELSGLPFENGYAGDDIISLIARQEALNFQPGEAFLYSNSGYLLIGEIVRRASGQTLRAFADARIFSPLGMKNSHFHDDFREIVKNRAIGYAPREGGGFLADISFFDAVGDGGLYTTVEDLALWDANFYDNIIGGYGQDLIAEITTPGRINSGETLDYAFGLFVGSYRGLRMISHSGSWMGYRAEMIRFPAQRFSVICLANLGSINLSRLAKQVADLYLAEAFSEPLPRREFIQLPAPDLEDRAGFYCSAENSIIWELTVQDGRLMAEVMGMSFQLAPLAPAHFLAVDAPLEIQVTFESRSAQSPPLMHMHVEDESPEVLQKVSAFSLELQRLAAYAGAYYCAELDTYYRITLENGALVLNRRNAPPEQLKAVSRDLFKSTETAFEFNHSPQGEVTGFNLRTDWVRKLPFVKQ